MLTFQAGNLGSIPGEGIGFEEFSNLFVNSYVFIPFKKIKISEKFW